MKKLSQVLLEMSQHAAATENRAEATRAENRQAFETHASEARTRAQSAHDAFATRLDVVKQSIAEPWRELGEAFTAQINRVQRSVDERKNARDLAKAQDQADDAEAYAEIAAEFVLLAAAEAEAAMVEALVARAHAISLEKDA